MADGKLNLINLRYPYEKVDIDLIEKIFSGIFRTEPLDDLALERERIDNCGKFAAQFKDNIFQDEYAILYELANVRKATTGEWSGMEAIIDENKEIVMSAPQVNVARFAQDYTDSDAYDGLLLCTRDIYERITSAKFLTTEGFKSACQTFIEIFEKKYLRQVCSAMVAILRSPEPFVDYRGGRRREYIGAQGMREFYAVEMEKINSLRSAQRARQFVLDSEWHETQLDKKLLEEEAKRTEKLCELGIPEIDGVWSGLRRTHMIGIIGPPKGGKTTLSAFMAHKLLKEGRRVAIWVMEGSAQESWIDKLIAAKCYEMGLTSINTKDLRDGVFLNPVDEKGREALLMVAQARADLVQDEKLSFIEETGYVEDFLDVIDNHYRAYNKFDAIIVDSLLNLQTKTGRRKSEYLSSAYMQLKDYIEHEVEPPPLCIATAQFKQEAIKEARNSADITFDETSGGETAETIRTPDDVLGIFGTPSQIEVGRTTIHHIATRHTMRFQKTDVKALFGCALFFPDGA